MSTFPMLLKEIGIKNSPQSIQSSQDESESPLGGDTSLYRDQMTPPLEYSNVFYSSILYIVGPLQA